MADGTTWSRSPLRTRLVMTTPGQVLLSLEGEAEQPPMRPLAAHPVLELVEQARDAAKAGLHLPALFTALTLPDVCAALASGNARSNGSKYKRWLRDRGFDSDYAERLYGLRCSLLHQGSAMPDRQQIPIAFIEPAPGRSSVHLIETEVSGQVVLWLALDTLLQELEFAVRDWLRHHEADALVQRNTAGLARRRPEGLPPHAVGLPVIA